MKRFNHRLLTFSGMTVLTIFGGYICYAQELSYSLKGTIKNYKEQWLYFFQCNGDTLLLTDSARTNKNGDFTLSIPKSFNQINHDSDNGRMYKVELQRNQFFYILYNDSPVQIQTLYRPNVFYNIATDSLIVIKSEENKRFYEFQNKQQQLNVANYFLLQMMRLYPLPDPFHKQIEKEYFKRHKAMEQFVTNFFKVQNFGKVEILAGLIAKAYYQPILPDWKQPDPWRDSIISIHYFDYFNPAEPFYLFTNILSEKIEQYLKFKTNKKDAYGQAISDEMLLAAAAQEFLDKTKPNHNNFEFCLHYLLKKLSKEHFDNAFLYLYDNYTKPQAGDCKTDILVSETLKEKADQLRNISIGSIASNFEIEKGTLSLSSLQSDYTLLVFYASWCEHCLNQLPEIKKATDEFNQKAEKQLFTVAVSLDTSQTVWQEFVKEGNYSTWLNISDLRSWAGTIPKQYNVYATPTMFLLDKDKKIIAKPETAQQLINTLMIINDAISNQ